SPPIELLSQDPKILETLIALRTEKKIRSIGISVRSPEEGLLAADFPFEAIQVNFNLTDQRALENGFFQKCLEKKIGVIVRTPLSFGFLSGAVSSGETFTSSDHRNRFSPEQRARWTDAYPLFREAIGPSGSETPSQSALRFCLSFEAVSTAIPGMLLESHVDENTRASGLAHLSLHQLKKLGDLYRSHFNEKIEVSKK
ncbi:MAG: aldo/keto reductase, partial [Spirochaetia bacterium]|nr:aldo/keto reductase [Spirochaetia bacterium]